jgi:Leucine Rich repeat
MSDVTTPSELDVVMGRGPPIYKREGNKGFRLFIQSHDAQYESAEAQEKPRVVRRVLRKWKRRYPSRRFLEKVEGEGLRYAEVKDEGVRKVIAEIFKTLKKSKKRKASTAGLDTTQRSRMAESPAIDFAQQGPLIAADPNNWIEAGGERTEGGLTYIHSLSELSLPKGFKVEQAKSLAAELKLNTTLTLLRLDCNEIGVEGAAAIADALTTNNTLEVLVMFGKGAGDVLKGCSELQAMDLLGNGIGDDGAVALASALERNKTLEVLDLKGTAVGDRGVAALARALIKNSVLTELRLNDNAISSSGVVALADAFRHGSGLFELHVSRNGIDHNGASALSDSLRGNTSLKVLKLKGNRIGDHGACAMSTLLKETTRLTVLDLNNNGVGDCGCIELAQSLKENNTLKMLDLGCNVVGDDGAHALSEALRVNFKLTDLVLERNKIGSSGVFALVHARHPRRALATLCLKGNKDMSAKPQVPRSLNDGESYADESDAISLDSPRTGEGTTAGRRGLAFHQEAASVDASCSGHDVDERFKATSILDTFHLISLALKSGFRPKEQEEAFGKAAIAAGLDRYDHPNELNIEERVRLCLLARDNHIALSKVEEDFLQMVSQRSPCEPIFQARNP